MKTKTRCRGMNPRLPFLIPKRITINFKIFPKMRYIYTLLYLLSFTGISQVSIPDTLNIYTSKYEAGLITLAELDSSLAAFFGGLPEDREITRYEKEYNRGMAFWKDRTMYDGSGNEVPGANTKALID